ncbi:hypothetical protein CBR_g16100 [Chara braunii]|uniref:Uncharacterized protein n=1 Tax=Chara braunii TaxID=69332 RepID=A0A388KTL0_CHABU|nr:hypothetical protein CBR_g16100 [Chara braunii]|eukprot:GBG73386.1 hypothetical protein CBR_g16100 [Chara braunii]
MGLIARSMGTYGEVLRGSVWAYAKDGMSNAQAGCFTKFHVCEEGIFPYPCVAGVSDEIPQLSGPYQQFSLETKLGYGCSIMHKD